MGNRRQILFDFEKLTQKKTQKRVGNTIGEVRLLLLIAAPIHVEWQTFGKKGIDRTKHSEILEPLIRYVILKVEIKDKMYLFIDVYALNKDTKNTVMKSTTFYIGEDFNRPPNPVLDKKRCILNPRKSVVTTIGTLQEELDLVESQEP